MGATPAERRIGMPRILVLGGGVCGLAAALMLARDGHEVTLLERDPQPVPDSVDAAWETWQRRGVAQFHQAHFLLAGAHRVLDAELPDVRDALAAAGGLRFNHVSNLPPAVAGHGSRPGDERFNTITARRPTIEYVFGHAAAREPGVDVRRGVAVAGVLTGTPVIPDAPHVIGVRTDTGEELRADLVVDAMGRRSRLARWLVEAGARPCPEEAEDSGFSYYTRFFQSRDGGVPKDRGPQLAALGSFSIATFPSDNDTWSVTLVTSSRDRSLTAVRDADRWTAVVAACPLYAHWLDGESITDVLAMGGIIDSYRRLSVDGSPVATGVASVADAWACTNPSLGRGISLGLQHVQLLRDVVRSGIESPVAFAKAWDAATEERLTPWYRATVQLDRARLAEMEALRSGQPRPVIADPATARFRALAVAAMKDPDIFRCLVEIATCLTPAEEVLARPGLLDRLQDTATGDPPSLPGPDRAQLLRLLG